MCLEWWSTGEKSQLSRWWKKLGKCLLMTSFRWRKWSDWSHLHCLDGLLGWQSRQHFGVSGISPGKHRNSLDTGRQGYTLSHDPLISISHLDRKLSPCDCVQVAASMAHTGWHGALSQGYYLYARLPSHWLEPRKTSQKRSCYRLQVFRLTCVGFSRVKCKPCNPSNICACRDECLPNAFLLLAFLQLYLVIMPALGLVYILKTMYMTTSMILHNFLVAQISVWVLRASLFWSQLKHIPKNSYFPSLILPDFQRWTDIEKLKPKNAALKWSQWPST